MGLANSKSFLLNVIKGFLSTFYLFISILAAARLLYLKGIQSPSNP